MILERIFDSSLAQSAWLVGCNKTKEACLIDPERDIDRYLKLAEERGLKIVAVTETHVHADFLSGSRQIAEATGATVYLSGEGGEEWKYTWLDSKAGGGFYTHTLLEDGDAITIGNVEIRAVHTPGHTPEHLSFLLVDEGESDGEPVGLISGDFVFVGDVGRPDLLEKSVGAAGTARAAAAELHDSLRWFDRLDPWLQVWPGHGAGSACGKALGALPSTTVGFEQRHNEPLVASRGSVDAFIPSVLEDQPDPPLYFARMKKANVSGVPLLDELPKLESVDVEEMARKVGSLEARLFDTRPFIDFRRSHLEGSWHLPFGASFPTVAASYASPDDTLYVVLDPDSVDTDALVRTLVRVGLDKVGGYVTPKELEGWLAKNPARSAEVRGTTPDGLKAMLRRQDLSLLDVRNESEYRAGHLPGAYQLAHTRLPAGLANLPDGELYVYCKSGARSAIATSWLMSAGRSVTFVSGGIDDLEQEGVEIERESSPAAA